MARRSRFKAPSTPVARADSGLPVVRSDSFANVISAIGTSRDPSYYNTYALDLLTPDDALDYWRGNAIAGKVVETHPKHAWREGFELCINGEEDETSELARELEAELESIPYEGGFGVKEAFKQAGMLERALGGAAIFPVILDGGGDFSKPLNTNTMRRIENLLVFDARELVPETYYRSLLDPKFGLPETYRVQARSTGGTLGATQVIIHESRLIIFSGFRATRDQRSSNRGWGDSVLTRIHRTLDKFGMTWEGLATLMHRIEQGVLKKKGISEALAQDQDQNVARALLNIDKMRSTVKMLVIDGEDDYQRIGVPLSGIPEILTQMMNLVACDADLPVTFLFGQAPAGLNATGESDTRSLYDAAADYQSSKCQPRLEQLIRLHMLCKESATNGVEPDDWDIKWRPLWQPTAKEIAEANLTQAQADQVYIDTQVLSSSIVRRSVMEKYAITEQEMRELEQLAEQATEAQQAMLAESAESADPTDPAESDAPDPSEPSDPQA